MVKWNQIICGDCVDVMLTIPEESIDLIYADPPFYSGKEYVGKAGSFTDKWLTFESYLAFMKVRLTEMHRILKPTGSLYLHCDPSASHYLKIILDQIFGHDCFLNEIIWYYRGAGTPNDRRAKRHDIILWYAKQNSLHYFNPDPIRWEYADATKDRFKHKIGNKRNGKDYGDQTLNPLGKHPDDVISDIQPIAPSAKERTGYPTQKPVSLLEDLIKSASRKNEIVLDPFCGSGTTCEVAKILDRKYIGIDVSTDACDTSKKRV